MNDVFSQFKIFFNFYLIGHKIYNLFYYYFCKNFIFFSFSKLKVKKAHLLINKKMSYIFNTNTKTKLLFNLYGKLKLISSFYLFVFLLHTLIYFFDKKINLDIKRRNHSVTTNIRHYSTNNLVVTNNNFSLVFFRTFLIYFVIIERFFSYISMRNIELSIFFITTYSKYKEHYFHI